MNERNIVMTIDPSGKGTTGICLVVNDNTILFQEYKNQNWFEHFNFLVELIKKEQPTTIVYENTTYLYGRPHQGTVNLYKLIGAIGAFPLLFPFIRLLTSLAANQIKIFKKKLFLGVFQIEGLTYQPGRSHGWYYQKTKISIHQLDSLIIYHLWSGGSLESIKIIKKQVKVLKNKKRLGIRQKEKLEKLEAFLTKRRAGNK